MYLNPPHSGQGEMTNWCVFACAEAAWRDWKMCEYASAYLQEFRGYRDVYCCLNEQNPTYPSDVHFRCNEGVFITDMTRFINEVAPFGTYLYFNDIRQLTPAVLETIQFPCFGIMKDEINHCYLVTGIDYNSNKYATYWTFYLWNPYGGGRYVRRLYPSEYSNILLWLTSKH